MAKAKKTENDYSGNNPGLPIYRDIVKPGLHIIKGPTASGKTSMLVDFSLWALENGHKIMFSSMDVNTNSLVEKFWANTHLNPFPRQKSDRFRLVTWRKDSVYYKACQDDSFELSTLNKLKDIEEAFKTIYGKPKKDILVIDHASLIKYPREEDWNQDTPYFIRELRRFAKKNKISVVISLPCLAEGRKPIAGGYAADKLTDHDYDTLYWLKFEKKRDEYPFKGIELYREKNDDGTNCDYFLLKPLSKFYMADTLCRIALKSILKGKK